MGIPFIGDIFDTIGDLVGKAIPDADKKNEIKYKIEELKDQAEARIHAENMGQIEINKTEANHASVFVAGWRPALGWVCAAGAGAAYVLIPLFGAVQAWWGGSPIPVYDVSNLMTLVAALLGLGGLRSFEVAKGVARGSRKDYAAMQPGAVAYEPTKPAAEIESQYAIKPIAAKAPDVSTNRKILWGSRVSPEFKAGVLWIEQQIGLNADFLMCCMAFETGQTFDPAKKNAAGSSGTGLIQFMAYTAKNLGTTVEALARMSAVQQLGYVYKYFHGFGSDFAHWTLEDVYMAILYPAAIGKPLNWHMPWPKGKITYKQNRGLDRNRDGIITKSEAASGVQRMAEEGKKYLG